MSAGIADPPVKIKRFPRSFLTFHDKEPLLARTKLPNSGVGFLVPNYFIRSIEYNIEDIGGMVRTRGWAGLGESPGTGEP